MYTQPTHHDVILKRCLLFKYVRLKLSLPTVYEFEIGGVCVCFLVVNGVFCRCRCLGCSLSFAERSIHKHFWLLFLFLKSPTQADPVLQHVRMNWMHSCTCVFVCVSTVWRQKKKKKKQINGGRKKNAHTKPTARTTSSYLQCSNFYKYLHKKIHWKRNYTPANTHTHKHKHIQRKRVGARKREREWENIATNENTKTCAYSCRII